MLDGRCWLVWFHSESSESTSDLSFFFFFFTALLYREAAGDRNGFQAFKAGVIFKSFNCRIASAPVCIGLCRGFPRISRRGPDLSWWFKFVSPPYQADSCGTMRSAPRSVFLLSDALETAYSISNVSNLQSWCQQSLFSYIRNAGSPDRTEFETELDATSRCAFWDIIGGLTNNIMRARRRIATSVSSQSAQLPIREIGLPGSDAMDGQGRLAYAAERLAITMQPRAVELMAYDRAVP